MGNLFSDFSEEDNDLEKEVPQRRRNKRTSQINSQEDLEEESSPFSFFDFGSGDEERKPSSSSSHNKTKRKRSNTRNKTPKRKTVTFSE